MKLILAVFFSLNVAYANELSELPKNDKPMCFRCYAADVAGERTSWRGAGMTRGEAKRNAQKKCEQYSNRPETCQITRCQTLVTGC